MAAPSVASATTRADACHGMHPVTLPTCPGCCLPNAQAPQQVLPCAAGGWRGLPLQCDVAIALHPGRLLASVGPVSARLALCGSRHIARQKAYSGLPPWSALSAVKAPQTEQMPRPARLYRRRGSHHLLSFQALGRSNSTASEATGSIAHNAQESSGWPIHSLLFSCSWQWVERMADLNLWLLCCCCLVNGM